MGLVPSAVKPPQTAEPPGLRTRPWTPWLVLALYLLGAVAVTWRLWADPASRMQVGDVTDVDLFAWFIRYSAESVAHGGLPALVTTAMNAPHGINLMWNTSVLLPGVLLTPVTLLAGAQTSLTLLLTLGYAGSAAAMYWVLRRWGVRIGPAALGGAVYGFSPALIAAAIGHYHLEFAVLPPLLIDALLRIVTGRGPAIKTGIWLGLLAAAQFFIGEELLVDTALAAVVVLVVVAVMVPHAVAGSVRRSAAGLAVAAGVALVICSYALWVQFHGPLAEHGSPWKSNHFRNRAAAFVTPAGNLLLHTPSGAAAIARHPAYVAEYVAYLGWPLLVVLIVAAAWYWRDLRVRVAAVACAVLEILSLGGTQVVRGVTVPPVLLPWHWLAHLPVVSQMLPDRLSILADGLAAVVLAVSLDLALSAAQQPRWRRRASRWRRQRYIRGAAAHPAAHAHHPGGCGPGRVPGGLHPAGAAAGRPGPGGAGALRPRVAGAALVRGDRLPRLDERRLLHRAEPQRQGHGLRRPGPPAHRQVHRQPVAPRQPGRRPYRRPAAPVGPALASGGRGRGDPARLPAGAAADHGFRAAQLLGGPGSGLAALVAVICAFPGTLPAPEIVTG